MLHAQAPAADPFDALADILPSTEPVAGPVFTGPEVTEVPLSNTVHVHNVCVSRCELKHGGSCAWL